MRCDVGRSVPGTERVGGLVGRVFGLFVYAAS